MLISTLKADVIMPILTDVFFISLVLVGSSSSILREQSKMPSSCAQNRVQIVCVANGKSPSLLLDTSCRVCYEVHNQGPP